MLSENDFFEGRYDRPEDESRWMCRDTYEDGHHVFWLYVKSAKHGLKLFEDVPASTPCEVCYF